MSGQSQAGAGEAPAASRPRTDPLPALVVGSGRTDNQRRRILAVLLAVSLVPLALVGGGAFFVSTNLLWQERLELQRVLVKSHAASIDELLRQRQRALEIVADTHSVAELAVPGRLEEELAALRRIYPGAFIDLGVIGSDGIQRAYAGPYRLLGADFSASDWFRSLVSGGSFISDVFLGLRQEPHLVIAIRRVEAEAFWVLRATIDSESFHALVRQADLGESGDAFIVNREGVYQTPPRDGAVLESSGLVPQPHTGVRDERVRVGKADVLRVSAWLNRGHWFLVVQQVEAEIMRPLARATAIGGLAVLAAMLLVIVTTFAATSHLTGRIDEAQRQRDALSRDLIRSAKLASLGELATGLAHEINNPLAIITAEQTNIADTAAETVMAGDAQAAIVRSVERCQRQIARCATITAKMLQFGRKAEPELRPTAIARVVDEIASLIRRTATARGIELELDIEAALPLVVLDANELEQVLLNLLNNALQAISGPGRITVAASCRPREVVLSVADTGCGIAAEHLDHIFEPFFTTKPTGEGTGLGLAVCYGIVRRWGGTIEAQSEVGKGSTFFIHLPLGSTEPTVTHTAKPARASV